MSCEPKPDYIRMCPKAKPCEPSPQTTEITTITLDLSDLRTFGRPSAHIVDNKITIALEHHPVDANTTPLMDLSFSDRCWIDEAFKTKMREQVLRALILELLA